MFIGKSQTNGTSNVGNSGTCPTWQLSSFNIGGGWSNAIDVALMQTLRLMHGVKLHKSRPNHLENSSNGVNKNTSIEAYITSM